MCPQIHVGKKSVFSGGFVGLSRVWRSSIRINKQHYWGILQTFFFLAKSLDLDRWTILMTSSRIRNTGKNLNETNSIVINFRNSEPLGISNH